MDRRTAARLGEDVIKELAGFAERRGYKITCKGGKYDPNSATLRIELAEVADDGMAMTPEARDLSVYYASYGLPKDCYGREFMYNGVAFRVEGLNRRAPKFPVLARNLRTQRIHKFRDTIASKING